MEIDKCYQSGFSYFSFWRTSLPEHRWYNPHPHKASSLAINQKGKLPTTVQCEKYEQIAVEAPNGGHPFHMSALKDRYQGGIIWIPKEEFGQAGKMGVRKNVCSRGKSTSKCVEVWKHVSGSGTASSAPQPAHRIGLGGSGRRGQEVSWEELCLPSCRFPTPVPMGSDTAVVQKDLAAKKSIKTRIFIWEEAESSKSCDQYKVFSPLMTRRWGMMCSQLFHLPTDFYYRGVFIGHGNKNRTEKNVPVVMTCYWNHQRNRS